MKQRCQVYFLHFLRVLRNVFGLARDCILECSPRILSLTGLVQTTSPHGTFSLRGQRLGTVGNSVSCPAPNSWCDSHYEVLGSGKNTDYLRRVYLFGCYDQAG